MLLRPRSKTQVLFSSRIKRTNMLGLLHYAVLYYAMLYFAIVLHYAMLNKAMLYYTILYVKVPPHGWRKVDHVKHR